MVKRSRRKARKNPARRMRRNAMGHFVRKVKARKNPRRARRIRRRRNPDTFAGPVVQGTLASEFRATGKTGRKRKKPGPKKGSKRKRRKGKKPGPKKGTKRIKRTKRTGKRRKGGGKVSALARKLHMLEGQLRAGRKRRKAKGAKRRRRSVMSKLTRARISGIKARMAVANMKKGKGKRRATKYMKKHGLARINPSLGGLWTAIKSALPEMAVGAGGFVALAWAGVKAKPWVDQVVAKVMPADMAAKYGQYVLPATVGLLSTLAYGVLLMQKDARLRKMAMPALLGGIGATTFLTVKAMGKLDKIGLGEYTLGEYTLGNASLDVDGANVRLNGVGEYTALSGGIFGNDATGSLGALPAPIDAQLNEGREDLRGTRGEPSVMDLESVDGGSLQGDIFN